MAQPINLALQGGGAHGAFTWGVLDRLLESERFAITGISGASAGAMNATVLADGLARGGPDEARRCLGLFWDRIAAAGLASPLRQTPLDWLAGAGNLDYSPAWHFFDSLSRVASPYDINPFNRNPLLDILRDLVDFPRLRRCETVRLFLAATNVRSGKVRIFDNAAISADAVMASACLPFLYQAVEIDGEHYWDGGYMGNPPVFPLIYHTNCRDVLLVQLNPTCREDVPRKAQDIHDRINELAFNAGLMREMRAIAFVTRLLDQGEIDPARYKRMLIHRIALAETQLGVSSKLNVEGHFLARLRDKGRQAADRWLATDSEGVGHRSTIDLESTFL